MHFIFAEVCASNSSEPTERFAETMKKFDIVISVLYKVKNKNIRIVYIYYVIYLHIYFYFYFYFAKFL